VEKLVMKQITYFYERYVGSFVKKLNRICEPFFISNGISHFVYVKIKKDGQLIFLNTDEEYSGNYIDLGFFNDEFLFTHPDNIDNGALVLSSMLLPLDHVCPSFSRLINFAAQKFHYDHMLVLIEKKYDFYEIFSFATHPDNKGIFNAYLSGLEKYKLFSKYFLLEAYKYIKKIDQDPINFSEVKKDFFAPRKIKLISSNIELPVMVQKILRHYGLTQAESICLSYFSQGLSAKEIAIMRKLSFRTVENHLQNIKDKLNIHSKSRLLRWYREWVLS
jgi:DNA-binding CsgD family transcriptional regulator